MKFHAKITTIALMASANVFAAGTSHAAVPSGLTGTIKIDGSSTVYPITEAVAENFGQSAAGIQVTVGISGTGGGFKKFCAGEIDISDASRPIKQTEIDLCKQNNIEYIELPVAFDALTIVVNPKNTWASNMTVADLKKIWEPAAQGKITSWNQVRPEWPNKPLKLFGPGVDSGTYDYFTEAVVGTAHSSRGDYTSSEDDNMIVRGVATDEGALGFFGLAYFHENQDKLKAVAIDDGNDKNGKGPQVASVENVLKGVYQPLARPLFLYVAKNSASRAEVKEFVKFYLENSMTMSKEVGYIPLTQTVATMAQERFHGPVFGSIFASGTSQVGMSLEQLMKLEKRS